MVADCSSFTFTRYQDALCSVATNSQIKNNTECQTQTSGSIPNLNSVKISCSFDGSVPLALDSYVHKYVYTYIIIMKWTI